MYAQEHTQPYSPELRGLERKPVLFQQAVVFPIKDAGHPFREHLIVTCDDAVEFKGTRVGDEYSRWLSFQNAGAADAEDEVYFNKNGFSAALKAVVHMGGRGWKRLQSTYGEKYCLVRAYENGDQTLEPVVLLLSDVKLDYDQVEAEGYHWKGVYGQDPVATAFKLADAKDLLKLLVKMDENKHEFDALVAEREVEREKFFDNPLKYRVGEIAPVGF